MSGRYRRAVRGWFLPLALLLGGCARPAGPPPAATATATEAAIGVAFATIAPPTASVRQTTPTPLPPPTVTPAPTPSVYVIEEGDTVLGIAIAENTTTAEILALNPGLRPELLQIGQQIVLPPPATPIFGQAAATPLPLDIVVDQAHLFRIPSGATWLLGDVRNEADFWAENVRLTVAMIGPEGDELGEATAWVAPQLIPPEGVAPFALLWPGALPAQTQPLITLADGRGVVEPGRDADTRYLDLIVESADLNPQGEAVELTGRVVNTGAATAVEIVMTASLYDSRGRLAGFVKLALPEPLAAGAGRSFSLTTAPPGGTAVRVTFHVQGLQQ